VAGLIGEDSREGLGEFVAAVVCELKVFFGVGMDEVDCWALNPDAEVGGSWLGGGNKVGDSAGSAISGCPVTTWKLLSSIATYFSAWHAPNRFGVGSYR
jgi:hypothetical protein